MGAHYPCGLPGTGSGLKAKDIHTYAQVHIQQQIDLEKELEKLPAPCSVHETNTGGRKGRGRNKGGKKSNPWDGNDGKWDLDGINSGKYLRRVPPQV